MKYSLSHIKITMTAQDSKVSITEQAIAQQAAIMLSTNFFQATLG